MELVITTKHQLTRLDLQIENREHLIYLRYDASFIHPKGIKHNCVTIKNILRQSDDLREEMLSLFDAFKQEKYDVSDNMPGHYHNNGQLIKPCITVSAKNSSCITLCILKTEENLNDLNKYILDRLENF